MFTKSTYRGGMDTRTRVMWIVAGIGVLIILVIATQVGGKGNDGSCFVGGGKEPLVQIC